MLWTTIFVSALTAPSISTPGQVQSLDAAQVRDIANALSIPWPLIDRDAEDRLWAAGASWKMCFDGAATTFHPRIGKDAHGEDSLKLELIAATVAGNPLALTHSEIVRPLTSSATSPHSEASGADGRTVSVDIDRGSLVERWHLRRDSAEQTFVLDELDAVGELVLTLSIATDLDPKCAGEGWCFEGTEGSVDYGAATVIDSEGHRCDVQAEVEHGTLTLTVPESFVASAALPLVVDPILSSGSIYSDPGINMYGADVTFDRSYGVYVATVADDFSATDTDVYAYVIPASGTGLTASSAHVVDLTTADWGDPRCADLDAGDLIGVVAAGRGGNISKLWLRRFELSSMTMLPQQELLSHAGSGGYTTPDIGADSRMPGINDSPSFMIACVRSFPTTGRRRVIAGSFRADGTALSSMETLQMASGAERLTDVRIGSDSAILQPGGLPHFLVAWTHKGPSGFDRIMGQIINSYTAMGVAPRITITSTPHRRSPYVSNFQAAGGRTRALVAYEAGRPTAEKEILVATVELGAPVEHSAVSSMEGEHYDWDQTSPAVSFVQGHMALLYRDQEPGTTATSIDVRFASGDLAGGGMIGLSERRVLASGTVGAAMAPSVVLRSETGAPSPYDGLAVWTARGNLRGARVRASDDDIAGVQYCQPEPNSSGTTGWIKVVGSQSPFGGDLILRAFRLPPNVFGSFLCASASAYVPNVGGSAGTLCLSGQQFGRFNAQVSNSGPVGRFSITADPLALPQPIGTIAATSGQTWYFQCWYRDTVFGISTSNLTNAAAVTFE